MSSFTPELYGWFRFMAISLDELIVSIIKIVRYIKFDLVGFFFDWSKRMRMPNKILE